MASAKASIDTLTSLRFFAAAMIVVGHSAGSFGIERDPLSRFPHYFGVSFFFVLSGFILTHVYARLPDRAAVETYLTARFARVWPLHFVTFLLMIAIAGFVDPFTSMPQAALAVTLNLTLLQSWIPSQLYNMSFNGVAWSISVEAFFYVAFVRLIRYRDDVWWRLPAIGLIGAAIVILVTQPLGLPKYPAGAEPSVDMFIYVNPLSRLFEFTLGMATAIQFDRRRTMRIGFLAGTALELGVVSLFLLSLNLNWVFYESDWPARVFWTPVYLWLERCGQAPIFALLILIFAFQAGFLSRILQQPLYVRLGEISYATYLVHLPLLRFTKSYVPLSGSLAYAIFLALTLWASYILWRYVESPARRLIIDRKPARLVSGLKLPFAASSARIVD